MRFLRGAAWVALAITWAWADLIWKTWTYDGRNERTP